MFFRKYKMPSLIPAGHFRLRLQGRLALPINSQHVSKTQYCSYCKNSSVFYSLYVLYYNNLL